MSDKISVKIKGNNTFERSPIIAGEGNTIIQKSENAPGELDTILKSIMDHTALLKKEDVESIGDVVGMVREEMAKPKPKAGRLRNCIELIKQMASAADGIPDLADSLKELIEFIKPFT